MSRKLINVGNLGKEREARAALKKGKEWDGIAAAGRASRDAQLDSTQREADEVFAERMADLVEAIQAEAGKPGLVSRDDTKRIAKHVARDKRAKGKK